MNRPLTDLGFEVPTKEAFVALTQWLSTQGETLLVPNGFYLHCPAGERIEIWMQFDRQQRWAGMNLHYSGDGRMKLRLTEPVERHTNLLDGAYFAWGSSASADTGSKETFPIIFDMPDYHTLPKLELPITNEVQLAGFALNIQYFNSERAFNEAIGEPQEMAPEAFLATGLFRPVRTKGGFLPPESVATLSATVLEARQVLNPISNRPFLWMLAQTEGGTMDLLCAADALPETPKPGGVVFGNFYVSGRLLAPDEKNVYGLFSLN